MMPLTSAPTPSVVATYPCGSLAPQSNSTSTVPAISVYAESPSDTRVDQEATQCSVTLRNGQKVFFLERDIPAPPAVSFASNFALLNEMWDDEALDWCGWSYLVIKGVSIPISYWKEVYSRSTSGSSWKWGQWKYQGKLVPMEGPDFLLFALHHLFLTFLCSHFKAIVKRWRQSSEEDFWHEFANSNGKRMTYTAITKKLADLRIIEDEKLAAKVKVEYGCKFADVFSYKKGGKTYTKTKASGVAHQYQRIAGLTDDKDDK